MLRIFIIFICDLIAIPCLFLISYSVKFKLGTVYNFVFNTNTGLIYHHANIEPYFENIGLIILIWVLSLVAMNTYKYYSGVLAFADQIIDVFKAVVFASLILMAFSVITELIPNSRFVLLYNVIFGVVIFSVIRVFVNNILQLKDLKEQRCCIVGNSKEAQYIIEYILTQKKGDYFYTGSIYDEEPADILFSVKDQLKNISKLSTINQCLIDNKIKHLFVIKSEYPKNKLQSLIKFCEQTNISLHIYDQKNQISKQKIRFSQFADLNMLSYDIENQNLSYLISKRIFDLVLAVYLFIVIIPLMIMISLWIKYVSPKGSILFKQVRVGLNNKEFMIYKFRTMLPDAEKKSGPVWVEKNDSRYIFGGKFLRKFSLDELPQLINIIKNDMSLVGPRPERPFFIEQIEKEFPDFSLRHQMKGGVTGWAQIHGRAFLTRRPDEKLRYDLFYIKNASLMLDIKIIFKTFFIVGKGEEAY